MVTVLILYGAYSENKNKIKAFITIHTILSAVYLVKIIQMFLSNLYNGKRLNELYGVLCCQ